MGVKVRYEKGTTLQDSFYVGSDGTNDAQGSPRMVVVRASYVLEPAFAEAVEKIRVSAKTDEEKEAELKALPVQPEQIAEQLEKQCSTLEEFHGVCMQLALRHATRLQVSAQTGGGETPTIATEPQAKPKVQKEPTVAAEETLTAGKVPTEGGSAVKGFFARLPSKALGEPQRAVDVHSSQLDPIVAAELGRLQAENEQLKAEKGAREKDDELKEAMGLLTEMGALEDAKDREAFTKDLGTLDEKALGVVEKILRKVKDAVAGKKPAGPPKPGLPGLPPAAKPAGGPPKPPAGAPPKPPAGMPALSSQGNLGASPIQDGAVQVTAGMEPALLLQQIMFAEDHKKVLAHSRLG